MKAKLHKFQKTYGSLLGTLFLESDHWLFKRVFLLSCP